MQHDLRQLIRLIEEQTLHNWYPAWACCNRFVQVTNKFPVSNRAGYIEWTYPLGVISTQITNSNFSISIINVLLLNMTSSLRHHHYDIIILTSSLWHKWLKPSMFLTHPPSPFPGASSKIQIEPKWQQMKQDKMWTNSQKLTKNKACDNCLRTQFSKHTELERYQIYIFLYIFAPIYIIYNKS